ncbi:MAG TPA: proton-conducting transporter membrane subunit [Candidatus Cybelea sp.]|jgi:hydrogenase-4 component F|nr:proton-conducting transporter membrane subunit [Candidatus Cybelea sp.]
MKEVVAVVIATPLFLSVFALLVPSRVGRILTALGGIATSVCIVGLIIGTANGLTHLDALSAVFLTPVAIVYGTVGLYSIWYVRAESIGADGDESYRREFLALTNAFACAEAVIPLLTNMAGLWVALEVTTILAALLVRLQGTDASLEAAWKYILIASCGLAIGLIGVIVLYAAGAGVLGAHYSPQWSGYRIVAGKLDPDAIRLAFLLALIGFGTKMGLAPMHTWLPDAHGAGPTPTSAMLSGVLLSDALYVILRFASIANAALGPSLTQHLFFIVGLLSLFVGAFFLLHQRDIKRMLAYSSIEHMGIVACGLAFGARIAVVGALLHIVNHAAAKALAFFAAGRLANRFDTREIEKITGGVAVLPVSGTLFALAGLALAGMPPFGPFRSELMILAGGFSTRAWPVAATALCLLLVAFAGLARWTISLTAGSPSEGTQRGERDVAAIGSMLLVFAVVLGLGIVVPGHFLVLLNRASDIVGGHP